MAAVSGLYSLNPCPYYSTVGSPGHELGGSLPAFNKVLLQPAGSSAARIPHRGGNCLRFRWRSNSLRAKWAVASRGRRALAALQLPEGQEGANATIEEGTQKGALFSSERERLVGEWLSRNMVEHSGLFIREVRSEDYNALVDVQSVAFHESTLPLEALNTLSLRMFRAEVMSILLQKYRSSPAGRYICLVAMADVTKTWGPHCGESEASTSSGMATAAPTPGEGDAGVGSARASVGDDLMREMRARECGNAEGQRLAGVVDMAVLRDADVLQHLPDEEEEYVYLSGMAVAEDMRRRGVATALLAGLESMAAGVWGFNYAVLHVYEKNAAAAQLYARNGYTVVDRDPLWSSEWLGRPRRLLMIKRIA